MEANRDKQLEYIDSIKEIEKKMLVYIDESVIEMNICKDRGGVRKAKFFQGEEAENTIKEQILLLG